LHWGSCRDAAGPPAPQLQQRPNGTGGLFARCGSLIAWAKRLGHHNAAGVLEQTLNEEKAEDKKSAGLAESKVNLKAA
jgi:hypothetical protein